MPDSVPASRGPAGRLRGRGHPFPWTGVIVVAVGLLLTTGAVGALAGPGAPPHAVWSAPRSAPGGSNPAEPGVDSDVVTLSGVGDVIMGTEPDDLPPHGGAGLFDKVKEALAADLVMGNLETPLTEDTGRVKCPAPTPSSTVESPSPSPVPSPVPSTSPSPSSSPATGCHQFYLPARYANHLADAGFGVMNLANNHTNDMGQQGLRATRTALEQAGVAHAGAPDQVTVVSVRGVRVAVLGFSSYGWTQSLNNIGAAKALVAKASGRADLVVVQMQGGAEGRDKSHVPEGHEMFLGEDRGDLRTFTHAVIDAGADIVFGHGPHIMRGMEFYRGRLIAYSLGNFCGYGVLSSSGNLGVGGVLRVRLHRDGAWAGGELLATHMVDNGLPAPDPRRRALALVNRLSVDDFGADAASVGTDGQISAPPS